MDYNKETVKMITQISQRLAQVVASASFEFWERKDFRLYVKFNTLSKTEQDRMFNELELSVLGLFILFFEIESIGAVKEKQIVFSSLQKDLAPAFVQMFVELGIEEKYVRQWRTLINMRLTEYRKDFKIAERESRKEPEFMEKAAPLRLTWARIETITIDCLTHLRRGNVKEGDQLWKLLRKWFISLEAQISPMTQLA